MEHYTKNKVPAQYQQHLRISYKIRGNNVSLIEERPAFKSDKWIVRVLAQFRLEDTVWKVFWKDSKGKWHEVEDIKPSTSFDRQLMAVDTDTQGIFWS